MIILLQSVGITLTKTFSETTIVSSNVTAPQDAHGRLVLQVYLGSVSVKHFASSSPPSGHLATICPHHTHRNVSWKLLLYCSACLSYGRSKAIQLHYSKWLLLKNYIQQPERVVFKTVPKDLLSFLLNKQVLKENHLCIDMCRYRHSGPPDVINTLYDSRKFQSNRHSNIIPSHPKTTQEQG